MAKRKTSKKREFSFENMKELKLKPGLRFEKVDCRTPFLNTRAVHKAALIRTTKLSRTTLFRMVEPDSNPTLENVAEIMRALKAS